MIRLHQHNQLVQAAYQLADGADKNHLHALALMADHLELHNTHMHAARSAGPACPQTAQQTHVRMQRAQAKFERFKSLIDALPEARTQHLSIFARCLCKSIDAPDLAAFAARRKLDMHALQLQRAQLVARGAEAYLVFLRRLAGVAALPNLGRKQRSQPSWAARP